MNEPFDIPAAVCAAIRNGVGGGILPIMLNRPLDRPWIRERFVDRPSTLEMWVRPCPRHDRDRGLRAPRITLRLPKAGSFYVWVTQCPVCETIFYDWYHVPPMDVVCVDESAEMPRDAAKYLGPITVRDLDGRKG